MRAWLAVAADRAAVEAITLAAYQPYVAELGGPPLPMTADYGQAIADGSVWLFGEEDGVPLALSVLEAKRDHLMIYSLAVRPEARGRGLGRLMLEHAEARARARGLSELRLYTHEKMTRNIGIYGLAGFTETGRHPNEKRPGWIRVDMVKSLD